MKIAFRVDASLKIGTGHVMRCLTLGEELGRRGDRVMFICREHAGHLSDMIASKNFEVVRLDLEKDSEQKNEQIGHSEGILYPPDHAAWLRVGQETDAQQTVGVLQKDSPWDWLIVDHYALDTRWESRIHGVAKKLMVIDDLANRQHRCDLLLDQNFFLDPDRRYKGLLDEHCETLLGPKYALVRREFRQARKFCLMRGNGIARILVYFGGNDSGNLTGMALDALDGLGLRHLLVDAVVGPNNPHLESLRNQADKRPGTRLHIQPKRFAELMLRADLCVGAGGTTTWERLCLALPSVVITAAENQEAFTAELDKAGYVKWIGKNDSVTIHDIMCSLTEFKEGLEAEIHTKLAAIVDGKGAERVSTIITRLDEYGR